MGKIHHVDFDNEEESISDEDLAWVRSNAPRDDRSDILVLLYQSKAFTKETAIDISPVSTNECIVAELKRTKRIKITMDNRAYLTLIGKTIAAGEIIIRRREDMS